MKYLIIPFLLFCLKSTPATGQNNTFSLTPNIGISTLLLEESIGFHLGANPAYALSRNLSLEGQISFVHTKKICIPLRKIRKIQHY